jgi:hypothetical protein
MHMVPRQFYPLSTTSLLLLPHPSPYQSHVAAFKEDSFQKFSSFFICPIRATCLNRRVSQVYFSEHTK